MKILITGITGSGGSYLAEFLLKKPEVSKVIGTSRWHSTSNNNNLKNIEKDIEILSCDLTDYMNVYRIINSERPDVIFHLASLANVRDSFFNVISVYNNNVSITLSLLESIRTIKEIDGYDPLIHLCSTSEVYGLVDYDQVPINEKCRLNPINPYAASKLSQDSLGVVYNKCYDLKIIRTRMFAYLNARRSDLFATSFAKQIIEIEKGSRDILLHGNLNSVRTLLDVRDVCNAYWLATKHGIPGEVYNIGSDQPISVGEFLELLKQKASVEVNSKECPSLVRPSDVTLQIPDCTKFKKATNWKPSVTFDDSVEFFLQELRSSYDI